MHTTSKTSSRMDETSCLDRLGLAGSLVGWSGSVGCRGRVGRSRLDLVGVLPLSRTIPEEDEPEGENKRDEDEGPTRTSAI